MNRQYRFTPITLILLIALACSACASGTTTSPVPTVISSPTQAARPSNGQRPLTRPVVYVALGASDAVGLGSNQPGSQGYVPLLTERLPKGSHSLNLGISGIRLHGAITEELPLALSTGPGLVTIWLVTNDFVAGVPYDSYMQDLHTLLAQLRTGTQARIVMANLPNLTQLPLFAQLTATQKTHMIEQIQRWNATIASIAAQYGVTIVNLSGPDSQLTTHPEYVSADGFHPSPAGYVQLANTFWKAIQV